MTLNSRGDALIGNYIHLHLDDSKQNMLFTINLFASHI